MMTMKDETYLIWSYEHAAWWRGAFAGYTPDAIAAGRYSYEQARNICWEANKHRPVDEPHEVMVLESDLKEFLETL